VVAFKKAPVTAGSARESADPFSLTAPAAFSMNKAGIREIDTLKPCHPDRNPSDGSREDEWKDPENPSSARQIQGILPRVFKSQTLIDSSLFARSR